MLVIVRKKSERIHVGENIFITIVSVKGGKVQVGIEAPKELVILREEVVNELKRCDYVDDPKERKCPICDKIVLVDRKSRQREMFSCGHTFKIDQRNTRY